MLGCSQSLLSRDGEASRFRWRTPLTNTLAGLTYRRSTVTRSDIAHQYTLPRPAHAQPLIRGPATVTILDAATTVVGAC